MDETSRAAIDALADLNRRLLGGIANPFTQCAGTADAAQVLQSLTAGLLHDADRWRELQTRYYQAQMNLLAAATGTAHVDAPPPGAAISRDRRFRAPEWELPYFRYLAQSYLLSADWITEMVDSAKLAPQARKKLAFYARQYIDAAAPSNFPWSNPEALKLAAETSGESLSQGLRNLGADLDKGLVSMTDETAFEVGRNLATTPGAVVFENDFMQLIQYRPTTGTVHERPLLMVPPCINKFYILDLQPENSLVAHAIAAGHTVFMVSWRNMPAAMGGASWDDYLQHGVMQAIDCIKEICNTPRINTLGFCVGGTLLASTLAVKRARGDDDVASLTLLATMLDFSDTGELSVFIDEAFVAHREREFAAGGVLQGRELALTFASLRANDLIWPYVVNNYLKGRTPDPFDLLYWNCDGTNLPGVMYAYYLRNMYLENSLREPGKLAMCGEPVDLAVIDMPAYLLATREDHIVPWRTAFESTKLLGGDIAFVLGASGHIAGVINPALRNRRNYWVNPDHGGDADAWLAGAASQPGSWWTHWTAWLARHGGETVQPRNTPGSAKYPEIEAAPGRYVREKHVN